MNLKRLMIVLAVLVFLAGVGIAWAVAVCVHAGRSEADRSVRIRGETTGLRAWLLRTGVIKPEIGPEIQRAYRGLAQSDEFDGGCPQSPTGYGEAFAILNHHKQAYTLFESLLHEKNVPAQLYALCYFYRADHKRFWRRLLPTAILRLRQGVLRGDCVDDYRICDIVDSSTEESPFNGMDIAGADYPNYLWSCQTPGEEAKDLRDQVKSSTGVQLPDEITKISLVA